MKAISNRQFDKWVLLYYLLDFLVHKLQICEVNITDGTYKTFLNLLSTLGSSGSNGRDNPYHDYRIMSLHATAELLTKTVFIYDGYKDIIQLKENIFKFISNLATNPDPIEIDSYSMLRIFDISNPSSEIKDFVTEVPIGAKVDEGSLKSLTISLENLIDLHTNNNTPNSRSLSDRTLSLDFDF